MNFKKILSIAIALLITSGVLAQTTSFGPKLGVNFSKLRGDDAGDIEYKTGFSGGAFVHLVPGDKGIFALEPALMFQQRGATNESDIFDVTQEIKLNYISIPIPVKLRIPIDNTFYPNIFVGPEFSFLAKSTYSVEVGDNGAGFSKDELDTRKGDVGGIFGAGLDIESDRFFFNLELRYGLGALKIDRDDENTLDLKNSEFTILTGIGVRLGG